MHMRVVCLEVCFYMQTPLLSLSFPLLWVSVDQELSFQDKYVFYRFLSDEREDAAPPGDEEHRQSEEELLETLVLLSQLGPDAHLRMILRKR